MIDKKSDHHTHTIYSDGNATIDELAECAIEKGIRKIAITDHMPLPFKTRYAMAKDLLGKYRADIERSKDNYSHRIDIVAGLEIEFIPELREWIKSISDLKWEQLTASVHSIMVDGKHCLVNGESHEFNQTIDLGFSGEIKDFCRTYYKILKEAVETGCFQIVGHLDVLKKHNRDKQFFDDSESWYQEIVFDLLDSIREKRMAVEINTAGYLHPVAEPYPSSWIIMACQKKEIPLVLSSDAHKKESLGQFFSKM
ncbi:putative histidinol-phosphatase [Desulfamplus magnetovallimortis]|uniref:Histidinol-phosphatase n=1 Tax=Desulfamplus magnetovallimortis TaxID=1246637 RepID=A0A1W1H7A0_9BACT|nr:histidinol-phosphatase HisJ [Desulfamplus magnetovallimortis]SLM28255.1 putative histidinol-phosphatase [Desulfamplus magnetovallimortis]